MERNNEDDDVRTTTAECKEWLREYLTLNSHTDSRIVKEAANRAGFSASTTTRARKAMRIVVTWLSKSPPAMVWSLPPVLASPGGCHPQVKEMEEFGKDAHPSDLDLDADLDNKSELCQLFQFFQGGSSETSDPPRP